MMRRPRNLGMKQIIGAQIILPGLFIHQKKYSSDYNESEKDTKGCEVKKRNNNVSFAASVSTIIKELEEEE